MKDRKIRWGLALANLGLVMSDYSFVFMASLFLGWLYCTREVILLRTRRVKLYLVCFMLFYIAMLCFAQLMNPVVLTLGQLVDYLLRGLIYGGGAWIGCSMRADDWFVSPPHQVPTLQDKSFLAWLTLGLILGYLPLLLAFSPGNMYIDAYSQWGQAVGGLRLNNWHPLLSTAMLAVSYLFTKSPILYTFLQVVCCIGVLLYLSWVLLKSGFKHWIISGCLLYLCLGTLLLPNMVTIYKDNWYNLGLMLFTLYLLQIIQSKGHWLHTSRWHQLLLGLTALFCMLVRHNGLYVMLAFSLIGVLCVKGYRRYFMTYGLVLAVIYGLYQGPLMRTLKVEPASPSEKYSMVLQHIGAVIAQAKSLEVEDRVFLSTILPLEVWQDKYTPAMVDPVKFHPAFHKEIINLFPQRLMTVWRHILKDHPLTVLWAELQQVRPLWDLTGWEHGLPGTLMFHYSVAPPKALYAPFKVTYTFDVPWLRQWIGAISFGLNPQDKQTKPTVTTGSAWSVYLILVSGVYFIRRRKWYRLIILLPVLLNIGVLCLAMPAYNMRYLLNIIMIALVAGISVVLDRYER